MMIGPDFASVDGNGTPNLAAAKATGALSFAIVRACEGTWQDPDFAAYWTQLKSAGVTRGAYCLLSFDTSSSWGPESQMQAFYQQLLDNGYGPGDLPPIIDLEFPAGRAATGLTAQEALDWFLRAFRALKALLGYAPMIYTSYVVWTDPASLANLPAPELADAPWWVKYWPFAVETLAEIEPAIVDALRAPPCPPPAGTSWALQQTQGDAIKYPGFISTVDVNRANVCKLGSRDDFVAWIQRRVGVAADGDYGPLTQAAVRSFQTQSGLVVDGVVGVNTFAHLARVKVATP